MLEMGVIDPLKVTRLALQNAGSIASLILTVDCLIAKAPEPQARKRGGLRGGRDAGVLERRGGCGAIASARPADGRSSSSQAGEEVDLPRRERIAQPWLIERTDEHGRRRRRVGEPCRCSRGVGGQRPPSLERRRSARARRLPVAGCPQCAGAAAAITSEQRRPGHPGLASRGCSHQRAAPIANARRGRAHVRRAGSGRSLAPVQFEARPATRMTFQRIERRPADGGPCDDPDSRCGLVAAAQQLQATSRSADVNRASGAGKARRETPASKGACSTASGPASAGAARRQAAPPVWHPCGQRTVGSLPAARTCRGRAGQAAAAASRARHEPAVVGAGSGGRPWPLLQALGQMHRRRRSSGSTARQRSARWPCRRAAPGFGAPFGLRRHRLAGRSPQRAARSGRQAREGRRGRGGRDACGRTAQC